MQFVQQRRFEKIVAIPVTYFKPISEDRNIYECASPDTTVHFAIPLLLSAAAFHRSQFAHNLSLNTLEFCCLSHLSMFTTPLFSVLSSRLHFFFTVLVASDENGEKCVIASIFRCDTVPLLSLRKNLHVYFYWRCNAIETHFF